MSDVEYVQTSIFLDLVKEILLMRGKNLSFFENWDTIGTLPPKLTYLRWNLKIQFFKMTFP